MHWLCILLSIFLFGQWQIKEINAKPHETDVKKEKFKLEIESVKQQLQDLRGQLNELTSSNNDAKERNANVKYCLTKECIAASNNLFEWMNLDANPCEDFNEFACGNFIKTSRIPEDKKRWTASDPLEDLVYERSRVLLEDKDEGGDDFETEEKIKRFYEMCTNETRLEELGVQPLLDSLDKLGGWPILEGDKDFSDFKWYDQLYKLNENGFEIDTILDHSVEIDAKNNTWRVITLDQPDFGLSKEYLVNGTVHKLVKEYFKYMIDAALLLGADEDVAKEQLEEVLNFEIGLAKISAKREDRRDANKLYNPTSIEDLSNVGEPAHPTSWLSHFEMILKTALKFEEGKDDIENPTDISIGSDEKIIIEDPFFFGNLTNLISDTNPKTIANYMAWRVVKSQMNNLNKAARDLKEEFDKAVKGTKRLPPTWKKCARRSGFNSYSEYKLGAGASSMYVQKHFGLDEKRALQEMFDYIFKSFENTLANTEWMDKETRENAVKKMQKMDQVVAYPDELLDKKTVDSYYKGLNLEGEHYENEIELTKFARYLGVKQLRERVDPKSWKEFTYATIVNAFYYSEINAIILTAGILQGVFWNGKMPNYLNYGAAGGVVGHEITHGFDDEGRQRDFDGLLRDWWNADTAKKFTEKAQCVVEQFGNFTAKQVGLNLNGINTQGENIADMGGLLPAYEGYENWVKDNGEEQFLPGHDYTPKQLFWISYAHSWCSKYRDEALRDQITTGVHSPANFRVNGPLMNNKDFAQDFNCPRNSKMNPEKKCKVW